MELNQSSNPSDSLKNNSPGNSGSSGFGNNNNNNCKGQMPSEFRRFFGGDRRAPGCEKEINSMFKRAQCGMYVIFFPD